MLLDLIAGCVVGLEYPANTAAAGLIAVRDRYDPPRRAELPVIVLFWSEKLPPRPLPQMPPPEPAAVLPAMVLLTMTSRSGRKSARGVIARDAGEEYTAAPKYPERSQVCRSSRTGSLVSSSWLPLTVLFSS